MSFEVVFFFYQTHRATRRYGYLGDEKIVCIFGCTEYMTRRIELEAVEETISHVSSWWLDQRK